MSTFLKKSLELIRKHKREKSWLKVMTVLAALVVFGTVYALILPALTMEEEVALETPGIVLEQEAPAPESVVEEAPAPEPEPAPEEAAPAPEPAPEEAAPVSEPETPAPTEPLTQTVTETQTQAVTESSPQAVTEITAQAAAESQDPADSEFEVEFAADDEMKTEEESDLSEDTLTTAAEAETEPETEERKAVQVFTAHEAGLKVKVTLDSETTDLPENTRLFIRQILPETDADLYGASHDRIQEWAREIEDYELAGFTARAFVLEADGQRLGVDRAAKVEIEFDQPFDKDEDEIDRIFIYRYPGQDRGTEKPDFNLDMTEDNKIRGCRFHTDSLICDAFVFASVLPVEEETEEATEELSEEQTEEAAEDLFEELTEAAETPVEAVSEEAETEEASAPYELLSIPMVFEEQTQDLTVTVSALSGTFPAGTTMEVVPVEAEEYAKAVGEAIESKIDRMEAVDIIFRDAQGNEIEPARPVSVKMQSAQISEEKMPVIVHVDDQGSASVVDDAAEYSEDEIIFHTEEFSVYIIVYTVDFEYSVNGHLYQFSLPGGQKIAVSELMNLLGITGITEEVMKVEFSDESLVKVVRTEDDWKLESLQAFDTEERLTITLKNGDVIPVRVTDAQGSGSIAVSKVLEYETGMNKINGERIYFALVKNGAYVTDANGRIVYREMFMQGETLNPSTVTFTGLEDGEYEVWEMHGDPNNGSLNRSYDGLLLANGTAQIDKIRIISNSNGQQSASGLYNNNASIKNGSAESMTFRNTYKPASDYTIFEANKVWMDRKENVIQAPEGATIAFTLYKEVGGVTTPAGPIIVLDGASDNEGEKNPWQAVFTDLPKTENGQQIRYKVKETTGWPDYYICKNKGKNLMGENEYLEVSGGTIYNRHLLATIQIQKHFDIQPNKYSAEDWAEVLAKKQLSFELTNETTNETWYFTLDESFSQNGQLFFYNVENMQAGHYVLKEYRYKGLITDRKWKEGVTVYERDVNPGDNMDNPLFEMQVQNWYVEGQDEPEGAYIKALKVWDDLDDFDEIRPESVEVKLQATVNGQEYTVPNVENPITLSEENEWNTGSEWYNLPITDESGNRIEYSVEEVNVPDGYSCTQSVSENGTDKSYTFTNTHRPQGSGKIKLKKTVEAPAGVTVPDTYYFTIQDSEGVYWTGHSTSGPDGHYTAVPIHVNSLTGEEEIELPVGRYTINEVRDGIQINGYELTVTGEGTFDVKASQNEDVVVTNHYEERVEPPDEHHINIGLEKKWDDGSGNTTPPDGASAMFTVHQQKAEKQGGSTGQYTIELYDYNNALIDSIKSDAENTIIVSYTSSADKYPYTNCSVFTGNSWSYMATMGGNGEVQYSYTVKADHAANNIIKLRLDNNIAGDCTVLPHFAGGAVSYSDYIDTSYIQMVILPVNGSWSYTFRNLVQMDEDGNLYRYYITEDSCSPEAQETVFKDDIGNGNEHTINTTGQKVEVTNTYENEQTIGFEFSKIWMDIGNNPVPWPDGAEITVTLNAYTDTKQKAVEDLQVTLSAEGSAAGVSPAWEAETDPDGTVTTFKVEGLPKFKDGEELHYYVTETPVSGYNEPSYAGSDGNGLVFTGSETAKATDGQLIINTPEAGYALPSTGGPGTRLFTILGSILIFGAGGLLWRRQRKAIICLFSGFEI